MRRKWLTWAMVVACLAGRAWAADALSEAAGRRGGRVIGG
jgi:hypothetical protein